MAGTPSGWRTGSRWEVRVFSGLRNSTGVFGGSASPDISEAKLRATPITIGSSQNPVLPRHLDDLLLVRLARRDERQAKRGLDEPHLSEEELERPGVGLDEEHVVELEHPEVQILRLFPVSGLDQLVELRDLARRDVCRRAHVPRASDGEHGKAKGLDPRKDSPVPPDHLQVPRDLKVVGVRLFDSEDVGTGVSNALLRLRLDVDRGASGDVVEHHRKALDRARDSGVVLEKSLL